MATILSCTAAVLVAAWGVAHVVPTRRVIAGFEPISADNRRVLLQEWLAEAFTMWGVAAIVVLTVAVAGTGAAATHWVCRATAGLLVALAVLTALTGARTTVVWFKVCPVLLGASAVLLVLASFV